MRPEPDYILLSLRPGERFTLPADPDAGVFTMTAGGADEPAAFAGPDGEPVGMRAIVLRNKGSWSVRLVREPSGGPDA